MNLPARAKLLQVDRRYKTMGLIGGLSHEFIDLGLPTGNVVVVPNQVIVEWMDGGNIIPSNFDLTLSFASSDSIMLDIEQQGAGERDVLARVRFGAQSVYSTGGTYALDSIQAASSHYLDTSPVAGAGLTVTAWCSHTGISAKFGINVMYSIYSVSDVDYLRARARCVR